mmetsp:Transcript_31406/g.56931  ORF Transcript_31406/g.56931 Transcript_31406/m.56931 type:complete len:93 (+) Transcript_31406:32-310(+)
MAYQNIRHIPSMAPSAIVAAVQQVDGCAYFGCGVGSLSTRGRPMDRCHSMRYADHVGNVRKCSPVGTSAARLAARSGLRSRRRQEPLPHLPL